MSLRVLDDDRIVLTFTRIELVESGSQFSRLHAHNRINPRIEARVACIHLDSYQILLEVFGAVLERFVYREQQKLLQLFGFRKGFACENPLKLDTNIRGRYFPCVFHGISVGVYYRE